MTDAHRKALFGAGALIVCVALMYVVVQRTAPTEPIEVEAATFMAQELPDFRWEIVDSERYEEGMPYHTVVLNIGDEPHVLEGKEYMACVENGTWPRADGEVSKIVCWFAGGGHEIGLFVEGETYVVRERWIQESGGDGVNTEPYGPWDVLFVI